MREQGTFDFSANFEGKKEGSIDARQFVDTFADLLNFTGANFIANGFPVTVRTDSTYQGMPKPKGTYQCVDKDNLNLPASWKAISKGLTNKIIYLGFFSVTINPSNINQTEQGIIANAVNNKTAFTLFKHQNIRIQAIINQTRVIAELINVEQNLLLGNDPNAFTLAPKTHISILSREPSNAGTITADANTQTIILNDDGNGNPQDISATHTEIQNYVNANGPYSVQSLDDGNTRFVVNINGEIINYLYNGDTGDVGGTNNYQTVADDFVEIDPSTEVVFPAPKFLVFDSVSKEIDASNTETNFYNIGNPITSAITFNVVNKKPGATIVLELQADTSGNPGNVGFPNETNDVKKSSNDQWFDNEIMRIGVFVRKDLSIEWEFKTLFY